MMLKDILTIMLTVYWESQKNMIRKNLNVYTSIRHYIIFIMSWK